MNRKIILGKGVSAVRVIFADDGVQLRTSMKVIDGNRDMRFALSWIVDNEPPSNQKAIIPDIGAPAAVLLDLIIDLAGNGVALANWGPKWALAAARRKEA